MQPDSQPTESFAPADSQRRRNSSPSWLKGVGLVAAGMILFFGGVTGGYLIGRSAEEGGTATTSNSASSVSDSGSAASASAPRTQPRTQITASDFQIETTVLEQQCFGSAGCNVSYTIKPTYMGSVSDLEGRTLKVVYEVTGGDEPQIGHFSLNGTSMRYDEITRISTPTADAVLAARVTSVLES